MTQTGNFRAELLLHSANPVGDEAISFAVTHERFIHAEFMTHRAFARNASSSRAIPYKRMKGWTLADPALPLHLGRNRPGMQSGAEVDDPGVVRRFLRGMLDAAVLDGDLLVEEYDLHKEIVNRYLEPWGWINVVFTTGRAGFMNFLRLRMDAHAHPNIQREAVNLARLYRASKPQRLAEGEWHLPYVIDDYREAASYCTHDGYPVEQTLLMWSVAHCAWVSYKTVDGKTATWTDAQRRHDDCVKLKHMTPCEHQLRARGDHGRNGGNVAGFDQYRHMIAGESCDSFDYEALLDGPYRDRDWIVP